MTLALSDQLIADAIEPTAIDISETVLKRISVCAPYFALEGLELTDTGSVAAKVPLARPVYPETGLMEATQVARHLAILGSCAVAMQRGDDARHHYLATKAHFLRTANITVDDEAQNRLDAEDQTEPTAYLDAVATGSWIDRRSARALVKLMGPDGQASHVLEVHYTVMAPRMFRRLMPSFEPRELDVLDRSGSYVEPPVQELAGGGIAIDCGPIPAEMCAGHFPDYPAAPVALVMGRLARAAGDAMNRHLGFGELTYQIDEAKVLATKLGRAGQRLTLEARHERRVGGSHLMIGQAKADEDVIGEMEITLSVTSLPEPIPFPVNALA